MPAATTSGLLKTKRISGGGECAVGAVENKRDSLPTATLDTARRLGIIQ
jgi:hypothetical protein